MFIKHDRKSIRFKNYNYSVGGFYFVTICTFNKNHYFGKIENNKMVLNWCGDIINKCWFDILKYFKFVKLHEFVIMPNHIHGIIEINYYRRGAINRAPTLNNDRVNINGGFSKNKNPMLNKNSLSNVIRIFKSLCTYNINKIQPNYFKWQRNYYEHIIRNDFSFFKIKNYIINNPKIWFRDRNNIN